MRLLDVGDPLAPLGGVDGELCLGLARKRDRGEDVTADRPLQ